MTTTSASFLEQVTSNYIGIDMISHNKIIYEVIYKECSPISLEEEKKPNRQYLLSFRRNLAAGLTIVIIRPQWKEKAKGAELCCEFYGNPLATEKVCV